MNYLKITMINTFFDMINIVLDPVKIALSNIFTVKS